MICSDLPPVAWLQRILSWMASRRAVTTAHQVRLIGAQNWTHHGGKFCNVFIRFIPIPTWNYINLVVVIAPRSLNFIAANFLMVLSSQEMVRRTGEWCEIGAGAKATISCEPLWVMIERSSDATRFIVGQNSELFFLMFWTTSAPPWISHNAPCLTFCGANGSDHIHFNFGFWWQSSYSLLVLPSCGRHSQQCDSSSWNCSRYLKALELLSRHI